MTLTPRKHRVMKIHGGYGEGASEATTLSLTKHERGGGNAAWLPSKFVGAV